MTRAKKVLNRFRSQFFVAVLPRLILLATICAPGIGIAAGEFTVANADSRPGAASRSFKWIWGFNHPTYVDQSIQWAVNLTESAGSGLVVKQLGIDVQHKKGYEVGENGNAATIQMSTAYLGRPGRAAGAGMVVHDGGVGKHTDIATYTVTVNKENDDNPSAWITVNANHYGDPHAFIPSYWNQTDKPVKVRIIPSYRGKDGKQVDGKIVFLDVKIEGGEAKKFDDKVIPRTIKDKDGNDLPLSDYSVDVIGSSRTVTTLAFLGGVDGLLSELDLDAATMLFARSQPFLAPSLFDPSQDIYVGVDLTQWLSFPILFDPAQHFSFSNGVSDLLPGFYASTTPITLEPNIGFRSSTPYTGVLQVRGSVDGSIPEPSTLSLIALALAGLLFSGRLNRPQHLIGITVTQAKKMHIPVS